MLKSNALKIALIYATLSFLWIFFSDRLLMMFFDDMVELTYFQTIKGTVFVIASALLIFILVRREIRRKDNLIKLLNESGAWYKALMENIPNTDFFLFDAEKAFIHASGPNLKAKGIPDDTMKGKTIRHSLLPQRLKQFLDLHFNNILQDQEVEEEIQAGNTWYQVKGRPLKDKNRRIYGGVVALSNISNYKDLIVRLQNKSKEFEALYEEYQATNEELNIANEQLKASQERYRSFIQQSNEGIYRMDLTLPVSVDLDTETQIKMIYNYSALAECNDAFLRMYGVTDFKEIENKTLASFYTGAPNKTNLNIVRQFLKNGYKIENNLSAEKDQQGKLHYFSNNTIGIIENGYLIRLWGTQQDVTEREKAYEMLQEERTHAENLKHKYMMLFNNLNDAAILHRSMPDGEPGEVLEANKRVEFLLNYKSAAICGKNISILIPEFYWQETSHYLKTIRRNGHHIRETRLLKSNGEAIEVEISSHLFVYENQSVILSLIRDISARKANEKQIKETNAFLQHILDNLSEGIAVYDTQYRYKTWNKSMQQITGKAASEVMGKTPFELFPSFSSGSLKKNLDLALKGHYIESQDYQWPGSNKTPIWLSSAYSPYYSSGGHVAGIIAVTLNITARKQHEEELRRQKERAEQSDRLKTAFLSNVSHEIRTPLNGIIGFADLMSSATSDNERQKYFQTIKSSTDQLLQVITDILDMSLIEARQLKLHEKPFQVNELIDELIKELQENIALSGKAIATKAEYGLSDNNALIKADRVRLKQALGKLINNAEKYTSSGFIEVGYKRTGAQKLLFYVKDTGKGISESQQKIIFQQFRQIKDQAPETFSGTGLGLAIARGIAHAMGGKLHVKSRPGAGSTFTLTIPYISH